MIFYRFNAKIYVIKNYGRRQMKEKLSELFRSLNIEYYGVLSYSDCRERSPGIRERSGLEPRSAIVYLLPYYTGETENISRYAASLDYHLAIKEINCEIERYITAEFPRALCKGYGDHSPIDERHAALIAGLGISGDSGLLLNEKYGSYIFIGDMITDIEPELLGAERPLDILLCEGCGLCRAACPTGILRCEGGECLSAITQRKGTLTAEEEALMRRYNTAWGCDICQTSCPHNRDPQVTPIEFFYRERIGSLTRENLDSMDKEAFERRAFAWRGRKTVERNLEILYKENTDA